MVKRKSIEEVALPSPEVIYPRYLSTAPYGEDLFEGKSQERVKGAVEQYILNTDNPGIEMSEDKLPRLIGIEGKWGSGKSNVIKMLENDSALKDDYIFFTYDAWGNQEDLQRKAILYMLTKQLIAKGLLVKETKMRQYDPLEDKAPEEKKCTWSERLESLSSTTSFTKETTVPSIHNSTKWFGLVIVIMGLIIGILQIDSTWAWWVNALICLIPLIIFLFYLNKSKDGFKKEWQKMFRMYDSGATTDTTSYVISKEDPTSTEFKEWMRDLSESLEEGKKLVLVFDNMDRLSKEKVHTLWSSIHTFFADSNNGYENVWCIIPYDAQHLSSAFEGEVEEKEQLLQRFLQKTFPVIYQVPEPIITDYKDVVNKLMHRAFGAKLQEWEYDIINRCYRLKNTEPNVREIIAFINELVQIYHTWHEEIDVVSMAVFVLQKKEIDNPPKMGEHPITSENYINGKLYANEFSGALRSRDPENMQRNIAALHYGVNPEKAYTIMLKRVLRGILEEEEGKKPESLVPYLNEREHLSVLEEVFHELNPMKYKTVIQDFVFAETKDISQEAKDVLQKFWEHIANDFLSSDEPLTSVPVYMWHVLKRIPVGLQQTCATHIIDRLYKAKAIKGDNLYNQINELFEQPYSKEWSIEYICPQYSLEPEEFIKYVSAAQDNFGKYPITTDVGKLNEYLISLLSDDFPYVGEVKLIKEAYDLKPFVNKTLEKLSEGKSEAKQVGKLLQIQRLYYDKFQTTKLSETYIQQLWASVIGQETLECYPEILALKAYRNALEELPNETKHIAWLEERMYFYITTAELINGLPNKQYQYMIKLAKNVILSNHHDSNPTTVDWVKNWQLFVRLCQIDKTQLITFASDWGYQLTDNEKKASIKTLLAEADWIDALKTEPITPLADSLLKKYVGEIQACAITEFIQSGTITPTNSYWYNVLSRLIDTEYIPNTETGRLRDLVLEIIKYAAKGNKIDNGIWVRVVDKCGFSAISTQMYELRRNILNKTGGFVVNPVNFVFLHGYLEKTEINSVSHRSDSANVILVNIIDNPECQKIIMQTDYYNPIIKETKESASALHEKIKAIEIANPDSEFSRYLIELVNYLPKEQNKEIEFAREE